MSPFTVKKNKGEINLYRNCVSIGNAGSYLCFVFVCNCVCVCVQDYALNEGETCCIEGLDWTSVSREM